MRPVRKADNLTPSCAVVTKFGNLNFQEPSGPLQACNGTYFTLHKGDNRDDDDDDDDDDDVNFTLWPAMKHQRGCRDIAVLFL